MRNDVAFTHSQCTPGRRCGVLHGLFEKPCGGGAEESQHRGPAENIHVGHHRGLLFHQTVEQSKGAGARLRGADVVSEIAGDGGGLLLQHRSWKA